MILLTYLLTYYLMKMIFAFIWFGIHKNEQQKRPKTFWIRTVLISNISAGNDIFFQNQDLYCLSPRLLQQLCFEDHITAGNNV